MFICAKFLPLNQLSTNAYWSHDCAMLHHSPVVQCFSRDGGVSSNANDVSYFRSELGGHRIFLRNLGKFFKVNSELRKKFLRLVIREYFVFWNQMVFR